MHQLHPTVPWETTRIPWFFAKWYHFSTVRLPRTHQRWKWNRIYRLGDWVGVSRNQVFSFARRRFSHGWNFEGALATMLHGDKFCKLVDGFFDHVEITPFIVDGSLYPFQIKPESNSVYRQRRVERGHRQNHHLGKLQRHGVLHEINMLFKTLLFHPSKPNEAIENSQSLMKN